MTRRARRACRDKSAAACRRYARKAASPEQSASDCGKNDIGIRSPDSNSISQYFARISARIDFSGIAHVPIMKLIAAISAKLPSAAIKNSAKLSAEAGRCTGKTSATIDGCRQRQQYQPECRLAHRAAEPHPQHRNRLDQIHRDLAFDHFVRHFLIDRVPVERTQNPAHADVRHHLRQVVAGDRSARWRKRRAK